MIGAIDNALLGEDTFAEGTRTSALAIGFLDRLKGCVEFGNRFL
jgi:hypothetical protein